MEGEEYEYEYPLKPERNIPEWRDPNKEWFYYRGLLMGTILKAAAIYGLLQHSDVTIFVLLDVVILALDIIIMYPCQFSAFRYIKKNQKGPDITIQRICDFGEYLEIISYATAALVYRALAGERDASDDIQLCVSSVFFGIKVWIVCANLVESWTDNLYIIWSNKIFMGLIVFGLIEQGFLVAFGLYDSGSASGFIDYIVYFGMPVMYLFYIFVWIYFQQWCCSACCFMNNNGKCCCYNAKLVKNPKKKENLTQIIPTIIIIIIIIIIILIIIQK